ncbi:MAG: MMPL family transporter [Myxococcota bacterium]
MKRFWRRLAAVQTSRPWIFALVSIALTAGSIPLCMQLGLNSQWTALLPEHAPSVNDLRRAENRFGSLATLTVAVESPSKDLEAMQNFATELAARLDALPDNVVKAVDWNVSTYRDFVYENRHLYASLEDLEEARDSLQDRLDRERERANPFFVDLDDEDDPDEDNDALARLEERINERKAKFDRFPGGFYVAEEGDFLVLFVRKDKSADDAIGSRGLIREVRRIIDEVDPSQYGEDLKVDLGGSVVVALEETDAIARELVTATIATIVVVLLAIWAFFRRLRSIVLLGGSLIAPVAMTFAFAELTVDYLNTSTAFLGSIVIGNGINPNIIWLSRYFEERRGGKEVEDAIYRTHLSAWAGTLTASLAAALAYGSLMLTDFRGFRDFGIIGGFGMVVCWVGALTALPAFAAIFEKIRPLRATRDGTAGKSYYGLFFSRLVRARPKAILVLSALVTLGSIAITAQAVAEDPLEYNFRNLRSERDGNRTSRHINHRAGEIVGSAAQGNGMVMLLSNRADVAPLEAALEARAEEEGEENRLWTPKVGTIDDLLPGNQDAKVPLLGEIRQILLDLRRHADDETQAKIDEHIPPETIETIGVGDLPEHVARSFTELDGTRGRLVVVEATRSIWNGEYLIEWAGALRAYETESGEHPPIAGRGPVFADMIDVVLRDGPRAMLWALIATLLLTLVTFRKLRERLLTMTALLTGITWMAGTMAVIGMKLNFLNFVAFPITFGNGVDYGVNVMRRYSLERSAGNKSAVYEAIERTGGAVALCSLTTIIGYTSLYTSANQAINSFGLAMAISEVTCLFSAVLTMPAILALLEKR